jgi:hypothetical protein
MNKNDLEMREQVKEGIYNLIAKLYQEEVNNYNKYMNNNPGDKQRTRDHILTGSIYCKILHSIKEVKQ